MLACQAGAVLAERSYRARFRASLFGAAMSIASLFSGDSSVAKSATILVLTVAFCSVPRRADELVGGRQVDREQTASVLERFGFAWTAFDHDFTLPCLPERLKSETTVRDYAKRPDQGSLTKNLLSRFRGPITLQWILTVVKATTSVAPRYVTYSLLQALETSTVETSDTSRVIRLAVALGGCGLFQTWLNGMIEWFKETQIQYPAQAIVMSMVCHKSLRMPNVVSPELKKGQAVRSVVASMRMDGYEPRNLFKLRDLC